MYCLELTLNRWFSKPIPWNICRLGFFFFFQQFSDQISLGKKTDLNRFEPAQIYCQTFQDPHRDGRCNCAQTYLNHRTLISWSILGNATFKDVEESGHNQLGINMVLSLEFISFWHLKKIPSLLGILSA